MELSAQVVQDLKSGKLDVKSLRHEAIQDCKDIRYIENPISYEEFFLQHLLPNRPCVFGIWATESWRSRRDWVTDEGPPNIDFLEQHFGETTVPVANCDQEEFSSHCKQDMTLNDYLQYLREKNDPLKPETRCLYLKDWHFTRAHPTYEAYQTPVFFQSDWLNEFWDGRSDEHDDYRFVYFGPKGSWTPFHADVLRSYSWSANVCGKKLWWLYPPGQEEYLKDRFGQLVYDLRCPDLQDPQKFPQAAQSTTRLEVTQNTGEIIFVPSGWHHQVFNLEDTISINHNWLNGCSVDLSWAYVKSCLQDVKREIDDCRDMDGWHQQCQLILKANIGIDYAEFYRFVHLIATNRIQKLTIGSSTLRSSFTEGTERIEENHADETSLSAKSNNNELSHTIFDLIQVNKLLEDMLITKEFQELGNQFEVHPKDLLNKIVQYL